MSNLADITAYTAAQHAAATLKAARTQVSKIVLAGDPVDLHVGRLCQIAGLWNDLAETIAAKSSVIQRPPAPRITQDDIDDERRSGRTGGTIGGTVTVAR